MKYISGGQQFHSFIASNGLAASGVHDEVEVRIMDGTLNSKVLWISTKETGIIATGMHYPEQDGDVFQVFSCMTSVGTYNPYNTIDFARMLEDVFECYFG